ncbi:1826_t:CDS:2 [Cetraspora pellucida]|uniref:1826_t:CDS:1 n=1 Tax=Cetraspora pellucida TaxID=1433469 RepID=A0ACA9N296_9GLOM|nr:1826_t:CDS:2 [Cetraspora pellucida]
MRIKLAFEESLGRTRCWYPISEYQKKNSIKDLIKTISKEFKLSYKDGIELELDGFTLLPRADVELTIRDGDMIRVKPYIPVVSKGSKKRPFKLDSSSRKASSNKHVTRSVTRDNVNSPSDGSSSESDDSPSEKITKKSKKYHENGFVDAVEQKNRNRVDSSPGEEGDSDSSSSESSNEESQKDSSVADDSDSSKSSTAPDEKVKDGLNSNNDRNEDSDAEKNLPKQTSNLTFRYLSSVNNSSVSQKKTQLEKETAPMSPLNISNEQRRNDKVNKRTKARNRRKRALKNRYKKFSEVAFSYRENNKHSNIDESLISSLINKNQDSVPSESQLKSKATDETEAEAAQTIITPTKSSDNFSHAIRKTPEPLKLKPPMSLSSTSNKRKGYYQGMRNIKPTHFRFEDGDDALKECSNSNVYPQVVINNLTVETAEQVHDVDVSKTNVDDTDESMLEDQLPSPRAIITRDGEPMQIDVNSSTTSDKKVVTNNINCGPNYDQMEDYKGRPNVNDVIAYKVIELSSTTWTPGFSEFREAKILDYDPISHQVTLKHQNLSQCRKEETSSDQMNSSQNKFQIIDVDNEFTFEGHESPPEILNVNWNDLCSIKKVVV